MPNLWAMPGYFDRGRLRGDVAPQKLIFLEKVRHKWDDLVHTFDQWRKSMCDIGGGGWFAEKIPEVTGLLTG
jgi:hypothetical protein